MAVTGSSPRVQYTYSELAGGANHSRLTSIIYPNSRVLNYNYAAGLDDTISRLSSLLDSTGVLESYDYLGEAVVVARKHPQPGVDLTYIKQSGENNGDAGDQYTGLDRFGRIVDQRWLRSGNGSAVDRLQYSYDRNGNRLSRINLIDAAFSESYSYDDLNQLTGFSRGSHTRSWDYDAQGNWQSVTTDGSTQTRSHNAQNEITGISGVVTPTYDANGNLTRDETGRQLVYDAWNRLVAVKDSGGTTLKSYAYDGLHRRVSETASGTTTDFYYSDAWQVLEERVTSHGRQSVGAQYVWSPVYVDALLLRDRDSNGDGSLDERLWVVQDANYNVVAIFDNSGSVVERYAYDPFGSVTVLDADFNLKSGGSDYAWIHLHQGGRYDSVSGLYHFRFRDYSPTLGRWTRLDPLRYEAGDVNLYRAVFNAPTVYTDPSGQIVWLPILLIGGTILITGTSIAVNTGLPEIIGEANPQWAGRHDDWFGRWANRIGQRNSSAQLDRLWTIPGDEAAPAVLGLRLPKGNRGPLAQDISPVNRLGRIPETTPATSRIVGYTHWRNTSWRGIVTNFNRANTVLLIGQGVCDGVVIVYSIFD